MDLAEIFVKQHASKHFIGLRTVFHAANAPEELQHNLFSAFVVSVDGVWLLVTAAHVVDAIDAAKASGMVCRGIFLHDEAAGHSFKGGVALPKDSFWFKARLDEDGLDYAATPLPTLVQAALERGGIRPVNETAWQYVPPQECEVWALVGIPKESHRIDRDNFHSRLIIIPLEKAEPPAGAPQGEGALYGRLVPSTDPSHPNVDDIDGMSGGPVFGFKVVDGTLKYWAIGVQAGWRQGSRTANCCLLPAFLHRIQSELRAAAPK